MPLEFSRLKRNPFGLLISYVIMKVRSNESKNLLHKSKILLPVNSISWKKPAGHILITKSIQAPSLENKAKWPVKSTKTRNKKKTQPNKT